MQFDRSAEDLGNSIHLEHVNVQVPDQRLAQLFRLSPARISQGLGGGKYQVGPLTKFLFGCRCLRPVEVIELRPFVHAVIDNLLRL